MPLAKHGLFCIVQRKDSELQLGQIYVDELINFKRHGVLVLFRYRGWFEGFMLITTFSLRLPHRPYKKQ